MTVLLPDGRALAFDPKSPLGLAELCRARAHQLIRIPDGVSFSDAAALPVAYGTALRMMVTNGQVAKGEKVLILGASGGVGVNPLNSFQLKPVGINMVIGQRPQAAFGNSDGDQQMLEWTTAGAGARLGMLVLHDDAQREFAYGPAAGLPESKVGTFTQSLYDEAKAKGWSVISIKKDWKRVFAYE